MSFPRYPKYKDSGVEWLGEVPEHWSIQPFFTQFHEQCHQNSNLKETNLLSLSYGKVVRRDINSLDGLLPASFETYQIVTPNFIVFRLTDLQNDQRSLRTALVTETGIITSAYLAVNCPMANPQYANYYFRATDSWKVFYSMGGGLRQSMKYSDLKWLPILTPPLDEQTRIAEFLDRETGRMDALIEEQKRLIELLKEKRQALISHVVTKGLNPDAPMKDSGVEWLGQVPKHWEVKPLKWTVRLITDKCESDFAEKKQVGLENIEGWTGSYIHTPSEFAGDGIAFEKGDILFGKLRPYLAKVFCADEKGTAIGDFFVIRPSAVEASYLQRVLLRSEMIDWLNSSTIGAKMPRVNWDFMGASMIPVPPISEQVEIANNLTNAIACFTKLSSEAEKAIALMQERRSTLISAAVTGKIMVV